MDPITLLLPVAVGLVAYLTKALDPVSSSTGIVIGIIIILSQNLNWFLILLAFLILGTIATNMQKDEKSSMGLAQKRRKIGNVLGNGLAPLIMALSGNLFGFCAAVSTATADTLSSEIGILSSKKPFCIITLEETDKGADGAISPLGTAFEIIGAGIIASISFVLFQNPLLSLVTFITGLIGCNIDSVLGATLERREIIGNAAVNFISTLSAGLIGLAISLMV